MHSQKNVTSTQTPMALQIQDWSGRYAVIGCKLKQNANEGCNSCATVVHKFIHHKVVENVTTIIQLCKSCRTCFKFYCMFYCVSHFTCDRSLTYKVLCVCCEGIDQGLGDGLGRRRSLLPGQQRHRVGRQRRERPPLDPPACPDHAAQCARH